MPAKSTTADRCKGTRDRLAASFCDPPTLAELATGAGVSRYQLLRHFGKAHGLSPHAWLQQQRVRSARSLIRRGAPLVQVAAACGFADQSHVTRVFARHFGFTPGAWLLAAAGFAEVRVAPRIAYADASRPAWVDGFTKKTFTAMIEGVREAALAAKLITPARFDEGVRDLYRTTGPDGVFCYTFFKGVGIKP